MQDMSELPATGRPRAGPGGRPCPVDGSGGAVRGDADDRPGRDDRERRAAVHPAELGFSATGLAWVVNAYLISFGGLLLLAGRLGDLAGRRNVFLAGLAVFTVASMAVRAGGQRRGCWCGAGSCRASAAR